MICNSFNICNEPICSNIFYDFLAVQVYDLASPDPVTIICFLILGSGLGSNPKCSGGQKCKSIMHKSLTYLPATLPPFGRQIFDIISRYELNKLAVQCEIVLELNPPVLGCRSVGGWQSGEIPGDDHKVNSPQSSLVFI